MDFSSNIVAADRGPTVVLSGELDLASAPAVKRRISAAIDHPGEVVVIDVEQVTFLDALSVGLLVSCHLQAQQAGKQLEVRNARPSVGRVLALGALHRPLAGCRS
jgi:anti-sigma B factor antagonist